jgi:hypothetical protein
MPFDRRAFVTFNRIMSAALYPEELRDLRLKAGARLVEARADAAATQGAEGRLLQVEVTIDAGRVSFAVEDGTHRALLDIAILVLDSDSRVKDERRQTIDLNLQDDAYARCRRDGIPYSVRLPAARGACDVKVIVYDYAADVLGSTVVRIF